jgi:hypothetical protein
MLGCRVRACGCAGWGERRKSKPRRALRARLIQRPTRAQATRAAAPPCCVQAAGPRGDPFDRRLTWRSAAAQHGWPSAPLLPAPRPRHRPRPRLCCAARQLGFTWVGRASSMRSTAGPFLGAHQCYQLNATSSLLTDATRQIGCAVQAAGSGGAPGRAHPVRAACTAQLALSAPPHSPDRAARPNHPAAQPAPGARPRPPLTL